MPRSLVAVALLTLGVASASPAAASPRTPELRSHWFEELVATFDHRGLFAGDQGHRRSAARASDPPRQQGGKHRELPLSRRLHRQLRAYEREVRPEGPLLFPGRAKKLRPITREAFHVALQEAVPSAEQREWVATKPTFLFPVRVLGRLFRGKLLGTIDRLHRTGQLELPGSLGALRDPDTWSAWLSRLYANDWSRRRFGVLARCAGATARGDDGAGP